MDIYSVIEVCKEWDKMGSAVQQQFETVLEVLDQTGSLDQAYDSGRLNSNALRYMQDFLRKIDRLGVEDAGEMAQEIERAKNSNKSIAKQVARELTRLMGRV
jgi:hypothetical protein